jgi:hypothetical protein
MSIPTFHFIEIAETDDISRRKADRENAARPAVVEVHQQSKGVGQHRMPKAIIFPVVFRSEPHFTFGSAVVKGPNTTLYNDPRGSSGVWAWQRDGAGHYIGAWCWLRVDVDRTAIDVSPTTYESAMKNHQSELARSLTQAKAALDLNKIRVRHFLSFSAIAVKTLPTKTLSAALNPRTIGL